MQTKHKTQLAITKLNVTEKVTIMSTTTYVNNKQYWIVSGLRLALCGFFFFQIGANQSINQSSIISLLTHDKTHMLTPGNTQLLHRKKVSTSL